MKLQHSGVCESIDPEFKVRLKVYFWSHDFATVEQVTFDWRIDRYVPFGRIIKIWIYKIWTQ